MADDTYVAQLQVEREAESILIANIEVRKSIKLLFTPPFHLKEIQQFITAVIIAAEKAYEGLKGKGDEKRKLVRAVFYKYDALYGLLDTAAKVLPIPFWLKLFTRPILSVAVDMAIYGIVAFANMTGRFTH